MPIIGSSGMGGANVSLGVLIVTLAHWQLFVRIFYLKE